MKRLFMVAAALAFSATASLAQENCGPAATMEEHFLENFGERKVYSLLTPEGAQIVLLANDQTQTWTIVVVNGPVGCIVAAGMGVQYLPAGMAL